MSSYKNQTFLVRSYAADAVLATGLFLLSMAASAQSAAAYKLPPIGAYQTFGQLRNDIRAKQGYLFAVSPDERWIISVGGARSSVGSHVMTVVHTATGAKLQHTFTDQKGSSNNEWLPNCFLPDSSAVVYGSFVAKLSEKMSELSFSPYKPDPSEMKRGT